MIVTGRTVLTVETNAPLKTIAPNVAVERNKTGAERKANPRRGGVAP